ncbi:MULTISPECIES: hypothetical protein [Kribbella]|nr:MULTISPECIES: hypothetical protein [Kribbella]
MQAAMRDNVPHPPIASQGIMEPPLAVPARIESAEGDPLLGAVLIREGSTRVSHAQAILGVTASDLLQVFVDDRAQRRLIDELNNLALSSASSLTEADRARLRVATMPLDLVVGVDVDAGASVSLGDAVAAKVAQDHLNHKKQWDPAAKDVHLGETCLIALRDEGLISDEKYAWLAGRIAANISSIDSFEVQEDDRWAELLWLFTTRKRPYATVIRRPIATVLERDQGRAVVRSRDRVPLAVALAMRSRRGLITETAAERESRILESAVPADVLASNWAPSSNEVEVLVAPAVEAAAQRSISAEGMELAVRAIWYLSKHGQLAMPRNDLGPGGDRRSPAELVDGMTKNARGVRQLARAILDGRDGAQASTVIDDRGSIDVSAVGTAVPLRDDTIRLEFVPRSGPAVPPPRNPDDEYLDAIATLTRRLKEAVQAEEDVRSIDDGRGRAMYQARGMMPAQVDELREMLQLLGSHTDEYERNWRVADAIRQQTSTPSDG